MTESNPERHSESEELLRKASAGDDLAVDKLLHNHLPGLRAFVRLRMGKVIRAKESASDIVQSVCREVIQGVDRFRYGGEVGFRHWLYKTAIRKLANRQEFYSAAKRDARREVAACNSEADLLACYATLHSPSEAAVAGEALLRLEAAFDRLPESFRDVIVMSRIVGLSRKEVALEMGRTENAVGNLLHRALAELADIVARDEG
jgi:RNA polymerase sigma-70 factor, ECF subfamily